MTTKETPSEPDGLSHWHVLHVHPRCEKKMADFCVHHHLDHYMPLRKETKIYQRRKVTVEKPVFPGYVFVSFDDDGRLELLKTNHVVRILETGNEDRLVFELDQVRQALAADPTLTSHLGLDKGKRVRITGGPFQGIEGMVQDLRGPIKVLLNVNLIGQAVAVEVERGMLELLD